MTSYNKLDLLGELLESINNDIARIKTDDEKKDVIQSDEFNGKIAMFITTLDDIKNNLNDMPEHDIAELDRYVYLYSGVVTWMNSEDQITNPVPEKKRCGSKPSFNKRYIYVALFVIFVLLVIYVIRRRSRLGLKLIF
jgi:hypothetical protein